MQSAAQQFERGSPSRRRALDELDPHDLDVLAVLAAAGEPLFCSKLAEMSAVAGLKTSDGKRAINPGYLQGRIKHWAATSLTHTVTSEHHAYLCAEDVAHWVLERAAEQGTLPAIARGVQTVAPDKSYYYGFELTRLFRDARLDLYAGRYDEVEERVKKKLDEASRYGRYEERGYPLLKLYGVFAPREALDLSTPTMSRLYAEEAMDVAFHSLVALGRAAMALCYQEAKDAPAIAQKLAHVEAFRGDAKALERLAAAGGAEEALVAKMLMALVSGEVAAAREQAMRLIEASRGLAGRRKPKVPGFTGVLVTLLLLTSREMAHRAAAQALLPARKGSSSLPSPHDQFLRTFDDFLHNPSSESFADYSATRYHVRHGMWTEAWLRLLLQRFIGRVVDERGALSSVLGEMLHTARLGGYSWLASEFEGVLEKPTSSLTRSGVMLRLYEPKSTWEHTLDALALFAERVGATDTKERDQNNAQRLRWIVRYRGPSVGEDGTTEERIRLVGDDDPLDIDFDDAHDGIPEFEDIGWLRAGSLDVEPKRQRYRKGKWTKGASIGLAKLREESSAGKLPEEDARVCSHIGPTRDYAPAWALDEQVGLGLVGHPRVEWRGEGRAAEVIRAEPTLVVRERGEELQLEMRPQGLARRTDSQTLYEREGDQLLVYTISETHREIARVVGEGVRLPLDARERLESQLGELAGIVPLQSEVAVRGGDAETKEGQARPVLQLRRLSPGLLARLRVFPLGLEGPDFAPGRGAATVVAHIDGKAQRAQRDLEAEDRRVDALLAASKDLAVVDADGGDVAIEDIIACYELLTAIAKLPKDALEVLWPEGEALSLAGERDVRDMRISFRKAGDWLAASGKLELDDGLFLQMDELLERFAAREGRFVRLADGRILALTQRLRRRIEALETLGQPKRKKLQISPLALFSVESWLGDGAGDEVSLDAGVKEQLERLREARSIEAKVPATIQAELRDYQVEGFRWLARLAHWGGGACLADDMGVGKTLQALALILHRAEEGPALVVAPTSVCHGWIEQARRFCPTLRALRFGDGDRESMLDSLGPYDLLVVSYGLLVQVIDAISEREFSVAVLDEAQAIKNAKTKRARAARLLRAKSRVVTTGTPVENHLGEIWSQMAFLNPGLLGTMGEFERRYARPIQRDGDKRAADRLRRLLRPFILRRTKAQVLDELPPKTEVLLPIKPEPRHVALYERIRQEAQERMVRAKTSPQERMRLLGDLMRLRRAASHPRLVLPESELSSAKLDALIQLLDELRDGGHRALVFSQFVDHLSLVRERLDAEERRYQYLDGSTAPKKRQRVVQAFQRGEGESFLISLRAGGFGLNLTAADYVIHLDPWWNPAVEDQASDRAHRIGQTRPVTIYKLVSEGTIEERILELHGEKREIAAQLLAGTEASTSLGIEELRELLRQA